MKYPTSAADTREWRHIDKSDWSRGQWDNEADKMQWTDAATGLPCLIVRGPLGALCGYAGVPASHPWHKLEYSDCGTECGESWCEHTPESRLEVHGGITFASMCSPNKDNPEIGICHVVPGDEEVWWFGFDCGHAGDQMPGMGTNLSREFLEGPMGLGHYRDVDYVKGHVISLALQLNAI